MRKLRTIIPRTLRREIKTNSDIDIHSENHTLMSARKCSNFRILDIYKMFLAHISNTTVILIHFLLFFRRLSEIIPSMMTTNNLLIISHQATLRCIVNFLRKNPQEQLPYEKVPLHTLFKVTVNIDGSNMIEEIKLGVQCVDTYRAKPTNCRVDRSIEEAIASVPAHF